MAQLPVSPASGLIDDSNNLTLSWPLVAEPVSNAHEPYGDYSGWTIYLSQTSPNASPQTAFVAVPASPSAGQTLSYSTVVSLGTWFVNMKAIAIAGSVANSNTWTYNGIPYLVPPNPVGFQFPDPLSATQVAFTVNAASSTTMLLGEPLTVTLQPSYTGADQWQILWPDNTTTGWLPLSANVAVKQFQIPGPLNVVVQTRRLYNSALYSPPVLLMRQITVQIFVVDQEFNTTAAASGALAGTAGFGGVTTFEIVDASSGTVTPNPWEMIARFIVRDTVTNELKLGVATSRFSNASSLLGTMGIDFFPLEGRPKDKELITPVYEIAFNSLTSAIPVKITTTSLPSGVYVGKPLAEFQMVATGGKPSYTWYTDALPAGLKLSVNGVLSGTPLALGNSNINFAVQDASIPFYIAEVSLPITVETDLLVQIAGPPNYPSQKDANQNILAPSGTTLGIAQVNTPYSVLMVVGSVNPAATSPGGLPPYTWSIPAGALPIGLSINPSTGLISGSPCTYNSTTDYNKTYSAVVQVTDAIGAKATQTYTMTLEPAALTFGLLNQPTIYAAQQFKLTIPVYGGFSPYTLIGLLPGSGDSAYYGAATLVDGQVEVDVNFPNSAVGNHTFTLVLEDAIPTTITVPFNLTVEAQLSDPFLVPAFADRIWGNPDNGLATPLPITGVFAGFSLGGLSLSITSVNGVSLGTTVYNGAITDGAANAYANTTFVISGCRNATNNGTFLCTASSASSLTLVNTVGVAETLPHAFTLSRVFPAVSGSLTNPSAPFLTTTNYTGVIAGVNTITNIAETSGNVVTLTTTGSIFVVGEQVALVGLTVGTWLNGLTVTLIAPTNSTTLTFNDPTLHGTQSSAAETGTATQVLVANAYAGQSFTITGFTHGANNGTFYCVESTATGLVLSNNAGVAETHAGTATQPAAKALWFGPSTAITPYGTTLANGITVVVDPTIPEIEFTGTSGGVFGTAQYAVPIQLQRSINNTPTTVATFSQTYTFLTEDNSSPSWHSGDIGSIQIVTRPFLVSEIVGLNPRKPYFNSSDIPPITPSSPPADAPWTAVVLNNSSLPPGLSLDTNTGLVYGTLVGVSTGTSIIEYVGVTGQVHGEVTITWNTAQGAFPLIDNIQDGVLLGSTYPASSKITVPNGITPISAAIYYGRLPQGLTLSSAPSGQDFLITGAATEGGYFDVWFQVEANTGTAYLYHRFSIDFIEPLIIATASLPTASALSYFAELQGFGGIPPYTWASPNFPSGTGTGGFLGLTLNANTGVIQGTLSVDPPMPWPALIGDIDVTLTDSRGTSVTDGTGYQPILNLYYNNGLRIVTATPGGVATVTENDYLSNPTDYSFQMEGAGGIPPYFWEINPSAALPSGIVATGWNGTYFPENGSGTVNTSGTSVTWVTGVAASGFTSYQFPVGLTSIVISGVLYSCTYVSPTTLTLGTSAGSQTGAIYYTIAGGWLFGQYDGTTYTPNPTLISITLKDSTTPTPQTVTDSFNILTGTWLLGIDTSAVGPIPRGEPYNGTLAITGSAVLTGAGVQWQVAPTAAFPNPLPTGLSVLANGQGATATIAGTYSGPILTNYPVRVIAVDATTPDGQTAETVLMLNTNTNLAIVGWDLVPATNAPNGYPFPPPNAVITGSYGPIQIIARNGVPLGTNTDGYNQYVWSSSPSFPFDGIIFAPTGSNSGQLSGTASTLFSQTFDFTVSDSLTPPNQTSLNITLSSQASGLAITTTSLPNATAGVAYSLQLAASGSSHTPYAFSVVGGTLPTGLSLSSTGLISGTTLQVGYNQVITFRVTDSIGAYSNKPLNLTVVSGLTLKTGIDYTDSTSFGILGYIDNGNVVSIVPRNNLSFYVVATGVVSQSPSQLTVILSSGFSAGTITLAAGVAKIPITGPFSTGSLGAGNTLSISVTDSGVTATATFNWTIYADGALNLTPTSGSIPTKLTTAT